MLLLPACDTSYSDAFLPLKERTETIPLNFDGSNLESYNTPITMQELQSN